MHFEQQIKTMKEELEKALEQNKLRIKEITSLNERLHELEKKLNAGPYEYLKK